MNSEKIANVLLNLPKSDEAIAKEIGVSSKTIKRIKAGTHKVSGKVGKLIQDYLIKTDALITDLLLNP